MIYIQNQQQAQIDAQQVQINMLMDKLNLLANNKLSNVNPDQNSNTNPVNHSNLNGHRNTENTYHFQTAIMPGMRKEIRSLTQKNNELSRKLVDCQMRLKKADLEKQELADIMKYQCKRAMSNVKNIGPNLENLFRISENLYSQYNLSVPQLNLHLKAMRKYQARSTKLLQEVLDMDQGRRRSDLVQHKRNRRQKSRHDNDYKYIAKPRPKQLNALPVLSISSVNNESGSHASSNWNRYSSYQGRGQTERAISLTYNPDYRHERSNGVADADVYRKNRSTRSKEERGFFPDPPVPPGQCHDIEDVRSNPRNASHGSNNNNSNAEEIIPGYQPEPQTRLPSNDRVYRPNVNNQSLPVGDDLDVMLEDEAKINDQQAEVHSLVVKWPKRRNSGFFKSGVVKIRTNIQLCAESLKLVSVDSKKQAELRLQDCQIEFEFEKMAVKLVVGDGKKFKIKCENQQQFEYYRNRLSRFGNRNANALNGINRKDV